MADYDINVPDKDDSFTMESGKTLQITFVEARRFCCTDGTGGYFQPSLPVGSQVKDYVWTGTALANGHWH